MKHFYSLSFTMLLSIAANAQFFQNSEITFSPFGTNTLGMNSSLDWQFGARTDISSYGGLMFNTVNAWTDIYAQNHAYGNAYPNLEPDANKEVEILKNKKFNMEIGYYYPIKKLTDEYRITGRVGFFSARSAFGIIDADEKNDGTGMIKNPFYGVNVISAADTVKFGPYGLEKSNYFSTGYGAMHSNGAFVGVSLNKIQFGEPKGLFGVAFDLYADLYYGAVSFDDLYLYGAKRYKLYNTQVNNVGYRVGLNMKMPAQKAVSFFYNVEFGQMPGYNGYNLNQRSYFQFMMGVSLNITKEHLANLNPF